MQMSDRLANYWALQLRYRQSAKGASAEQRRQMQADLRKLKNVIVAAQGQQWLLGLAKNPRGLRDWFWFNHFNVYAPKGHVGALLPSYLDDVIFKHGEGRFDDLLLAAITHPAMQVYLDNVRNVKGKGNENLARELLELHTLGVEAAYTQADVQSAAKVLTGWGLDEKAPGEAYFAKNKHDEGAARVMGWASATTHQAQLPDLLQWLARQPATAQHLATRCCWWALSDDTPRPEDVAAVKAAFVQSGGQIKALWQAVDALALRRQQQGQLKQRLKAPMTYVVHVLGVLLNDARGNDLDHAHKIAARGMRWLRQLGQPLFGRTSPDGYPLRGSDWLSSGQLAQRFALAQEMASMLNGPAAARAAEKLAADLAAQPGQMALGKPTLASLGAASNGRQRLALLFACPEFMSEAG